MNPKNRPLPVPIPPDLADKLQVTRSFLSHVNAGRKIFSLTKALEVMDLSLVDIRLVGVHLIHLRPDLAKTRKWICAPLDKKRRARG
jgi:hypothetical protein